MMAWLTIQTVSRVGSCKKQIKRFSTAFCAGELRRYFVLVVYVVIILFFNTGCQSSTNVGGTSSQQMSQPGEGEAAANQSLNLVFTGAVVDTLRGTASFGLVIDPETLKERFVIKLSSARDLTGGVFISRADTSLPERGTYHLGNLADETAVVADSQFVIVNRKGFDRYLKSAGGTLSLEVFGDTLITGRIDAIMTGWVVRGGEVMEDQEVRVRGQFEADNRPVGYIIGL